MDRESFDTKKRQSLQGTYECARANTNGRVQIVVWVGERTDSGKIQCRAKDDLQTYAHIAAINDSIQEIDLLYEVECRNRSLMFPHVTNNDKGVCVEILHTIPVYPQFKPPPPTHRAHELTVISGNRQSEEIIRWSFAPEPVLNDNEFPPLDITVELL